MAFSWSPFHRVSGTVVVILIGVLLVPARLRRGVFLLLSLGAGSYYLLDFFLYKPSGLFRALLWPITGQRFASDEFYLSSDRRTAVVAVVIAVVVWVVDRW